MNNRIMSTMEPPASATEMTKRTSIKTWTFSARSALLCGFAVYCSLAFTNTTEMVSVNSAGEPGNLASIEPSVSANGRYVAFSSTASNLVNSDTNGTYDVFVHDRMSGLTERVSVSSGGAEGNGESRYPSISADGRFVSFYSLASNLVADDTNSRYDVFVHDRDTGLTELISVDSSGVQGNANSWESSISSDGRFVAFLSQSSNLIPDDTNLSFDVFVHDRDTGETERVSVDSSGMQASNATFIPTISAGGRYVVFWSFAPDLVAEDTNGQFDVFVHDRVTGVTERISVTSTGAQANSDSRDGSISADGRFVAFRSYANNLVANDVSFEWDVFVHDRETGLVERVSVDSSGVQGNAHSHESHISGDGRYVAFASAASNLVPGDNNGASDVFIHDRDTGQIERVSVSSEGVEGVDESRFPSVSFDGRFVVFSSLSGNLVEGDSNGVSDIFLHDRSIDLDNDGVANEIDNCPTIANPDQTDVNMDGYGDACVSPDAQIPDSATIGANPEIGAGVTIDEGVSIGDNVYLGNYVQLKQDVAVGDNFTAAEKVVIEKGTTVGDNVTIGLNSEVAKFVEIGSGVIIGEGVVINKGVVIEDNVLIDDFVTILKDAFIGAGASIGAGALIGSNALVSPGAVVPAGTIVGTGAIFP